MIISISQLCFLLSWDWRHKAIENYQPLLLLIAPQTVLVFTLIGPTWVRHPFMSQPLQILQVGLGLGYIHAWSSDGARMRVRDFKSGVVIRRVGNDSVLLNTK